MLIGLVGKPSCGKSTFFKAATMADVLIASYPFATIKPNHGIGYVKTDCIDKELGVQCQPRTGYCENNVRFIPIEIMDVAGLVKGASEGKGLGNQFLDDLRQADAFIQIVDVSGTTDAEGKESDSNIEQPIEDVRMLENELDLWYKGIFKKVWDKLSRTIRTTKQNPAKAIAKQFSGLKATEEDVKSVFLKLSKKGIESENLDKWSDDNLMEFAHELRLITKPMIIAANKIDKLENRENIEKLKNEFPDYKVVPCSADSELSLRQASRADMIEYIPGDSDFTIHEGKVNDKQKQALESIKEVLEKYGSTGVQNVLDTLVFEFLEYMAIWPAGSKLADSKGNVLPDCFLLPKNSTALDFAYHLHTDIGDNFIKAIDVRTKQPVGKDHPLKHRDGIEIVTR